MAKITYQIMKKKKKGLYVPDYEELLKHASCEEERDYIREVEQEEKHFAEYGFPEGFEYNMVYITKQACGHYEIFQTPCNEFNPLQENLKRAREHSKERCSKCICNWQSA